MKKLLIKAEELAKLVLDLDNYDLLSRRAVHFLHTLEREKKMAAKKPAPKKNMPMKPSKKGC